MSQSQAKFWMLDASPDILIRLTPTTLVCHWKATSTTSLLNVSVDSLYSSFHRSSLLFVQNHLQANLCRAFLAVVTG